jgi:hypothetical protein
MKSQTTQKSRRELKKKMNAVFGKEIQNLPADLQTVLLDDLVTAFENRLRIFEKVRSNLIWTTAMVESVEYETV